MTYYSDYLRSGLAFSSFDAVRSALWTFILLVGFLFGVLEGSSLRMLSPLSPLATCDPSIGLSRYGYGSDFISSI